MSKEKAIRPEGIMTFKPHEKAPDFVKGTMVISPNKLFKWLKTMEEHKTEYKGEPQFRFQLQDGDYGISVVLDTWKKDEATSANNAQDEDDDLPF